jgi:hypothetical protein
MEEKMETTTAVEHDPNAALPQLTLVQDFAYGDERGILTALEGEHDHGAGPVTVTVLREVGPGGGWPEVSLEGTAPALLAFLLKHYTGGQLTGPNGALELMNDSLA